MHQAPHYSSNSFLQNINAEADYPNPESDSGNLSPSFELTLRKSQSAKLIEIIPISETPFTKPSIKELNKEYTPLTLTPKNLQTFLKDFNKIPPQSTKTAVSQSHTFGQKSSLEKNPQAFKEKTESFGNINKDITKTILTQMNNKGIIDLTIHDMEEGKLLEQTKPWKIACDHCLHKERTFIPKLNEKGLLCDFHKKILKQTIAPPVHTNKSNTKPPKNNANPKKIIAKKLNNKKLKFVKLDDFSYFVGFSEKKLIDINKMQAQNNELLKNLSEIYLAKNKLEDFLKILMRFLQQNGGFLSSELKNFKDIQDFFQNIKIGLDLSSKSAINSIPEQLKTLINEADRLKKIGQEKNMPLQEIKQENERLLKLIENLLSNNLLMEKATEVRFHNILKENLENMESLLEKSQRKNLDYEKFIMDFLDTDDGNEGFKNTLRTLIEYKKKLDGLKGLEDDMKRIQIENNRKNIGYLTGFDLIEKWLKKNGDIFKNCGNLRLSVDVGEGVDLMEKDLKEWRELFENMNKNKHENEMLKKDLEDFEEKYEEILHKKMELELIIEDLNKNIEQNQNTIAMNFKEIHAGNQTIEDMQTQLMNQTNDKVNTSVDSSIALDDKIAKSIEQLSLIILSKDKSNNMGEETKKFIKEVFGDNFAKNLNGFEKKFKEVYAKNEKLSKEAQEEQAKADQYKKDINFLISLILEIFELLASDPINNKKLSDLKQKLIKSQERINAIKTKCHNIPFSSNDLFTGHNNDMIFTNLRDSFAPFNQPLYGDTTMKERLTINAPNENSQNYQNLLKDFDLLKSKYDNILLENTILNRNHQQNRRSDESFEWENKSNRSKTPPPRDLNVSLNNLKKDTRNLKEECNRLKIENEKLKINKKGEFNFNDDYARLLHLQAITIQDL